MTERELVKLRGSRVQPKFPTAYLDKMRGNYSFSFRNALVVQSNSHHRSMHWVVKRRDNRNIES